MNKCVDDVVVAYPLFQTERSGSIPTSTLQLHFQEISRDLFRMCNKKWHSRLPLVGSSGFIVCYGAEYEGNIFAVAAWSNPVARLLPQKTWLELRRLAICEDAPKNTASRMIGWMIRDIKARMKYIDKLISYQDLDVHKGTIYLATNWTKAKNYVSRSRGWTRDGWNNRKRKGRTNQAVAPRMRWEYEL